MKKYLSLPSLVAVVLAALVVPSQSSLAQSGSKKFVPGELIVVLQPGQTIEAINAQYGTTTVAEVDGSYLLKLPTTSGTNAAARALRDDASVLWAGPNLFVASPSSIRGRHQGQSFPFDEAGAITFDRGGYDSQPFLTNLHIDEMTAISQGEGVVVAVIDTGVDLEHPDLVDRFARDTSGNVLGADYVDGGEPQDVEDPAPNADNSAYGHGTFIAGLIAKVAPEARIMPIRALGPDGVGEAFDIARAVEFAEANGAHVINMSFGAPAKIDGLVKELAEARRKAVLVAATGNFNSDAKQYPAEESFVLAVSALNDQNVKARFSNFGSLVDLSAPGEALKSTFPGGQYATWSGTSFSTPLVAATAALVVSLQLRTGALDVDCAVETLEETGRSLDTFPGNNRYRGKLGLLVDPFAAVTSNGCGKAYNRAVLFPVGAGDHRLGGEAEYKLDSGREEFEVEANGLKGGSYTLRVTKLGGATHSQPLSRDGNGRARLRLRSDEGNFPPELSPVSAIETVEILRNGTPVLRGRFSVIGDPGGGGDDDDDGGGGDDGGGDDDDDDGDDDDGSSGPGGGDDDGSSGPGDGDEPRLEEEITLNPTGLDPDAAGDSRWRMEGTERQEFKVEAYNLEASTGYELWVDGQFIAMLVTDSTGYVEIDFDSRAGPGDDELPLPSSLIPVSSIGSVVIYLGGEPVLTGNF